MPVDIEELSFTIKMDRQGGSAVRKALFPWSFLTTFVLEVLPGSIVNGYPYSASVPGMRWLHAQSIDLAGYPDDFPSPGLGESPNQYRNCLATVTYGPNARRDGQMFKGGDKSGPGGDKGSNNDSKAVFLSHEIDVSGEFLSIDPGGLRWTNAPDGSAAVWPDPKVVVQTSVRAGMIVPVLHHGVNWSYVQWPPWTAIRTCLGSVNSGQIMGAYPGTLLFLGGKIKRDYNNQFDPNSPTSYWSMSYKLAEKCYNYSSLASGATPQGWNYFVRPNSGGKFEQILRATDNTPIYPSNDFNTLFQQGTPLS
jgi:hypothetical protein